MGFSTSAPITIYEQQTCPSKANFAFLRTQKLWKLPLRWNHLCAALPASLLDLTACFMTAFECTIFSRGFGRDPKLSVTWVSLQKLCPWCWKRSVAGRSRLRFLPCFSLFPLCLYVLCAMLLVHVYFSLNALLNLSFPLCLLLWLWFLLNNPHLPQFNCHSSFWWV